jgi:hypothetical protein
MAVFLVMACRGGFHGDSPFVVASAAIHKVCHAVLGTLLDVFGLRCAAYWAPHMRAAQKRIVTAAKTVVDLAVSSFPQALADVNIGVDHCRWDESLDKLALLVEQCPMLGRFLRQLYPAKTIGRCTCSCSLRLFFVLMIESVVESARLAVSTFLFQLQRALDMRFYVAIPGFSVIARARVCWLFVLALHRAESTACVQISALMGAPAAESVASRRQQLASRLAIEQQTAQLDHQLQLSFQQQVQQQLQQQWKQQQLQQQQQQQQLQLHATGASAASLGVASGGSVIGADALDVLFQLAQVQEELRIDQHRAVQLSPSPLFCHLGAAVQQMVSSPLPTRSGRLVAAARESRSGAGRSAVARAETLQHTLANLRVLHGAFIDQLIGELHVLETIPPTAGAGVLSLSQLVCLIGHHCLSDFC